MASPKYTIRPFRPGTTDMSAITEINAVGNEHDELTKYMRRNIQQKWTSYRNGCRRFLQMKVASPGTVCYVAEERSTGEVVGWALWTRHGKSAKAKEWQKPNSGLLKAIERKLIAAEESYYKHVPYVDPTGNHEHMKQLMPVLNDEWPNDIFPEFWELDGLYVHPEQYRKGIGKMLALWGVEKGRAETVPVLVHSSPLGRRLYENVGFGVVNRMDGFDAYVPEFAEELKVKDKDEAKGCWAMCWQPDGTDFLERARRKAEGGTSTAKSDMKATQVAAPAEIISVT